MFLVCANLLSDKIREIELDMSSGASQIARNALGVLRFFVQTSKNETSGGFVEDFGEGGRRVFEARPNMAPVQNLVAQIVYEVNALEEHDLLSVRKFALSRIDELSEESETAIKKSAEEAAALIDDSDCLATCSYSSTVCETFKVAKTQGKSFKVFVAESRSDDDKLRYGQTLATYLKSIKVPAEVFADNEVHRYVPETKCVLVGADSLLFDGSIINGRPTYEVAVTAKEYGVPFYSVCETTKANTLTYLGKKVELKKGFDLVPANLITGIVTEKGILDTKEIVEVMKEKSKFFEAYKY
jgi:translation initiation factor 2B subunit (eIF-2B alpha/beta/delta family)